jgi:predicted Zn-dependent peptidase
MEFKHRQLDNGLDIIGEVNRGAQSAGVGFFVRTGSRDETAEVSGVSHFLEHMLFKGTDELSAAAVNEAFDRTGAQFNAFTSEENTVYYAAVLPEYLCEVADLWGQLMRPSLREGDFDIEKNVIKEEIAMYKDMPQFDVMDRCRSLHFGEHPCGNSVLGSEESIDALRSENMRAYFESRYAPNNVAACFSGNFDWDDVCRVVEAQCGSWKSYEVGRRLSDTRGTGRKERAEKASLVREHICMLSAAVAAQDERRYAASLLGVIVGDDTGSRFFWELVDKALCETASMQYYPMDGTGAFFSYVRCGTENVGRVIETVDGVFADLREKGISEEELTKAKNKALSALVIKNELPMGRLIDLGFNWVYMKTYREIEQDVSAVKAVTVEQVNALAREYDLGGYSRYSIGP